MADREINLLGLTYLNQPMDTVAAGIIAAAKEKSDFRYVVTPNVAHVVELDRDPETLKPLFASAWLRLCDSRVLAAVSNILFGQPVEVVPGSDLTVELLERASHERMDVCVVGLSNADMAELRKRYPGIAFFHHNAPMGLRTSADARAECRAHIEAAHCELTLLATGMPQQEMIAYETFLAGNAKGIGACIGASLDFIIGKQTRAPRWMQRLGCEWLFRLMTDPKRLARRYLIDCPGIFAIALRFRSARALQGPTQRA